MPAKLSLALALCLLVGSGGVAAGSSGSVGRVAAEGARAVEPRAVSVTLVASGATTVSWCSLMSSCATSRFINMTAVGNEYTDAYPTYNTILRSALLAFAMPADFWGSTVTSATLRLYPQSLPLQRDTTYRAYPIAGAWNPSTVTWNTMPLQYTGVEYWDEVPASGLAVGVAANWNMTAAVQGWASGVLNANGFLLMDPTGWQGFTSWRTTIFNTVTDTAGYRPQLILQYQPGLGWTCNGVPATWVGTDGANSFNGGPGVDVVVALGGNDVIDGKGGNDIICAGSGNDTIIGSAGNDFIHGEAGRDIASFVSATAGVTVDLIAGTATGGAGADSLYAVENLIGSSYRDFLTGRRNANRLEGLGGNDVLKGLGGDDVLLGGTGTNDKAFGGTGNDRCVADIEYDCEL